MASQFNSSGISTVNIISERSGSFAFLSPGVPSASFFESRSNIDAFLEASASVILELEPTTGKHLQFRIPSGAISTSEDAIPFFISKSAAPKIGIGTDTPLSTLDIVDVEDTADGFIFLIRNARTTTKGGDPGDAAGTINFIITSGSYDKVDASGSVGKIVSEVDAVSDEGVGGHIRFEVSDTTTANLSNDPVEVLRLLKDSTDVNDYTAIVTGSLRTTKNISALTGFIEAGSYIDASNYLRGDSLKIGTTTNPGSGNAIIDGTLQIGGISNVSASLADAGNVNNTGTPSNNQVAVWTNSTTIEGDADFTWSGTILTIDGSTKTRLTAVANDGIGGTVNANGEFGYGAEVWQGPGISDTSAGKIYVLKSDGTMVLAQTGSENFASGFLSYSTGTSSVNGMVLRGFVYIGNIGQSPGDKIYLADSGSLTTTKPTTSTHFVRIVGYASHVSGIIYFNPSNDYIQLA